MKQVSTRKAGDHDPFSGHRRRQVGLLLILVLPAMGALSGCAGTGTHFPADGVVFPPHRLQPVQIALTAPLANTNLALVHENLKSWSEKPSQRIQLMSCTWDRGADGLTGLTVPGTEVHCFFFGRNPLTPAMEWLSCAEDTTGNTEFMLTATVAVDQARHRGWTHLVVPRELHYSRGVRDTTRLALDAVVAVIDVLDRSVVWTGPVTSDAYERDDFGNNDEATPPLTAYEVATYSWLLDLCDVLDRIRVRPPVDLAHLSLECQKPPPVFSLDESAAELEQ